MLKVVRSFAFRRSASNLVLAEVNAAGELQAGSLSAITAAQQIGGDITAIGIFSFKLNASGWSVLRPKTVNFKVILTPIIRIKFLKKHCLKKCF